MQKYSNDKPLNSRKFLKIILIVASLLFGLVVLLTFCIFTFFALLGAHSPNTNNPVYDAIFPAFELTLFMAPYGLPLLLGWIFYRKQKLKNPHEQNYKWAWASLLLFFILLIAAYGYGRLKQ